MNTKTQERAARVMMTRVNQLEEIEDDVDDFFVYCLDFCVLSIFV